MAPIVSVIMNCHNGERYLHNTIKSLLSQTYKQWELIFFDNASTDSSASIVKKFNDNRIKYYKSVNKISLGKARYLAYKKCKGNYVSFLDVDDIWLTNKLQIQINCFRKDESLGAVYSNTAFFNDNGKEYFLYKKKQPTGIIFKNLLKKYSISFDTIMLNYKSLRKLDHVFDQRFNLIHDMDLLIRISEKYKFQYINQCLSKWRINPNSESNNKDVVFIEERKILLKKFNKIFKKNYVYKANKKFLLDSILRLESILNLKKKNNKFVHKNIFNYLFNYKNLLIVLISFLPFSNKIINYILKLKKF